MAGARYLGGLGGKGPSGRPVLGTWAGYRGAARITQALCRGLGEGVWSVLEEGGRVGRVICTCRGTISVVCLSLCGVCTYVCASVTGSQVCFT